MVNEKLDNKKKLNQETEKTEILPEKKYHLMKIEV